MILYFDNRNSKSVTDFLEALAKGSRLPVYVVVCSAVWHTAKRLTEGLAWDLRGDVDRVTAKAGNVEVVSVPLGGGERVLGERADVLILLNHETIPLDVKEVICAGMTARKLEEEKLLSPVWDERNDDGV